MNLKVAVTMTATEAIGDHCTGPRMRSTRLTSPRPLLRKINSLAERRGWGWLASTRILAPWCTPLLSQLTYT